MGPKTPLKRRFNNVSSPQRALSGLMAPDLGRRQEGLSSLRLVAMSPLAQQPNIGFDNPTGTSIHIIYLIYHPKDPCDFWVYLPFNECWT